MKVRLKKLLWATDFSHHSSRVMNYAVGLAQRFSAHLLILHAIPGARQTSMTNILVEDDKEVQVHLESIRSRIAEMMEGCDCDWSAWVTQGDPVEQTTRVAAEINAGLVMVASHGLSGLERMLVGNLVERMVRTLNCPLLIVPPIKEPPGAADGPFRIKRIVAGGCMPDDLAPVLYALKLAKEFHSELHLVHSMEAPDDYAGDQPTGPYNLAQHSQLSDLRRRIEEFLPEDADLECDLQLMLVPGLPAEQLILDAAKTGADLIVVGVRPHNVWFRLFKSSTTETVIRGAPCPVLAVPSAISI